jgi:hypothetical protein
MLLANDLGAAWVALVILAISPDFTARDRRKGLDRIDDPTEAD